jgi:hypothetical protein
MISAETHACAQVTFVSLLVIKCVMAAAYWPISPVLAPLRELLRWDISLLLIFLNSRVLAVVVVRIARVGDLGDVPGVTVDVVLNRLPSAVRKVHVVVAVGPVAVPLFFVAEVVVVVVSHLVAERILRL